MRRRPLLPTAAAIALALIAGMLASCGSSSQGNGVAAKRPNEIVAGAKVLADAATSVHVSGSIVSGGSPVKVDLHLLAGKGGAGRLSENGLGFEVIQIHGTVFIKGSTAFYSHIAGPAAAQLFRGKWLKAPTSVGNLASLASLTNLHGLMDTILADHGTLSKTATTTVLGRKVVGVTDATTGGTLYVAATGPPYPIVVTKSGASGGRIIMDQWNEPVVLTAPSSSIDITHLAGR
jgi:hypothetical protein